MSDLVSTLKMMERKWGQSGTPSVGLTFQAAHKRIAELEAEVAQLKREQQLDDLNETGWKERARKAEAEVAHCGELLGRSEAEVARLQAVLERIAYNAEFWIQ